MKLSNCNYILPLKYAILTIEHVRCGYPKVSCFEIHRSIIADIPRHYAVCRVEPLTANRLLRTEAHARSVFDDAPLGLNRRMDVQSERGLHIGMTENLADTLTVCACFDAACGECVP